MTAIPDRDQILADDHLATAEVTPEISNSSSMPSPKQFDASRYILRLGDDFLIVEETHVNFVRLLGYFNIFKKDSLLFFFLKGNGNGHEREMSLLDITFYDGYLSCFKAFSFLLSCYCPIFNLMKRSISA